jgi:hypothetical protein
MNISTIILRVQHYRFFVSGRNNGDQKAPAQKKATARWSGRFRQPGQPSQAASIAM